MLVVRFVRTGGLPMLRMMGGAPEPDDPASGHASHGMHDMGSGPMGPGPAGSGEGTT